MTAHRPPRTRPSPFCIRLTPEDRAALESRAGGLPLGTYAKTVLLGPDAPVLRRPKAVLADQAKLAEALAVLGASRLASNLNQLAKAANLGILPVTQETEADLRRACAEISELRALMMTALGITRTDQSTSRPSEDLP